MRTRSEKTLEILEAAKALLDPEQPMTLRHLYYLLLSDHVLEGGDAVASKRSYERLARDPDLRAQMGAYNRAKVEERFTLSRCVQRYVELYAELA